LTVESKLSPTIIKPKLSVLSSVIGSELTSEVTDSMSEETSSEESSEALESDVGDKMK